MRACVYVWGWSYYLYLYILIIYLALIYCVSLFRIQLRRGESEKGMVNGVAIEFHYLYLIV